MSHPLISVAELAAHLDDPALVILDVRGRVIPASEPHPHYYSHRDAYLESHIPGAHFVDWVRDITVDGPDHMQIAAPDKFTAAMERLGVGTGARVVTYDDFGGIFAARVWWALNYYGFTDVRVLDGAWKAWTAASLPVNADAPSVTPRKFVPVVNPTLRRTKQDVLAALNTDTTLIDVRSPAEFRGEASRAKRKGHIPGAQNFPAKEDMSTPDGLIQAPDLLRARFEAVGASDGAPVILYCNGGVSASLGLLALRASGLTGGAVYDGSWKDWGNDDAMPIE
jgi:thiosulfate/3-mercaptopyruvate sulfurtransferase